MTYEYSYTDHINPGVLSFKLTKEDMDMIWGYIKRSAYKGWTFDEDNNVITSAKHQQWSLYDTTRKFEHEILIPAVNSYVEKWGYPINIKNTHWPIPEFNRFWCRFSNSSEYQSLHDHQAIWSFVIWMNIPTSWEDEQEGKLGESHPGASNFCFCYTDSVGRIRQQTYKLDRSGEGTMLLFPSDFLHQVYPHFTSEEFRVSVAGDVAISSMMHLEQIPTMTPADLEARNFIDIVRNE